MAGSVSPSLSCIDAQLCEVLARFPDLVFGSVEKGLQWPDSDLDIAIQARQALSVAEKTTLNEALAQSTWRPIDLIDLKVVAEPLLGQIVRHVRRLFGSGTAYGQLISRHLFEQADFTPYRSKILAERRAA